jgi:hypothetical protein
MDAQSSTRVKELKGLGPCIPGKLSVRTCTWGISVAPNAKLRYNMELYGLLFKVRGIARMEVVEDPDVETAQIDVLTDRVTLTLRGTWS